ncbi:MAG: choice-of-anchor tandem repeat GloVer-containing protein, partial [Crocinitomicaceae bacterium]
AFSLNNGVYTKHYDFTYADAVSAPPGGSFVEHPNGNLYATTGFGNSFGQTSLFKFDTTTNTCSAIYDVQPFSDDIKAFDTEVVLHSNGLIYGCVSPGDNLISSPTIFSSGSMVYSYDPIADTLQVLSHIQNKHASALTEGYNSDLYGVTLGVSGAFNPFLGSPISKLFSFDVSAGSVNDHFTWPEKFGTELMYYMLDGPGGSMYGISFNGGANHTGTIFEYNAHTNTRSVLSDFQSNLVLFDNEFDDPGKFIKAGNKMFILNRFRLFSYSSGLSGLTLEHDFIPATGKQEEKITAGLDGNVYGHTRFGGTNNRGVIFRFNVVTSTYEVLRNFVDVASDKSPFCEVEPGVFYYTKMPNSGAHALYEYNSNTDVLTQKHVFTSMTDPYAQVIKAVNGKLYGFAMQGGSSGNGGVYEYDYQNDLYTEVVNLPTSLASTGTENVTFTEGVNQKLYAFQQGSKEVIEYDPLTNVATFNPTPYVPEGGGRSTGLIRNDFCANAYDSTSVVSCVPYIAPNGNTYSVSGSYTETISGVNLCGGDSIVTINLTILPSSTNTDVQSACDSYTWIDGNTYTSSNNTAQYVVPNAIGCDSIITLDLTINSFTTSVDQQTACNSYTWIDGNTYTSSNNTATFILPNQQGCDSIITLDLTLNEVAVSVSYTGIGALVATAPAAQTFQWVNCDSNYAEIPGETSLLYLPSTNGNYAVVVTDGSCTDTSACFTVADAGLEDDLNSNIRLYPNPTNDIITIQSSFVIDAIEVYSLTGELLFRSENENQVDLSSFANGSYLFKIQSGESISLQKVVKN